MKPLLSELGKLKVIQKGKFVLKSGEVSNFYIDIKNTFGHSKTFRFIVDELCMVIDKRATCVAGSGYGGLPLATAVSLKLGLPLVLVRDKAKKHGIQKMIDGYLPTKKDKVVIINDVFTMGTSMRKIIKALGKTNSKILAGYVVINRGDTSKFKVPVKSLLTAEELTK